MATSSNPVTHNIPAEEIKQTRVVYTIVGGKIVYKAN